MSTDKSVKQDRVIIFDTTLRDGEQSPGCTMNLEEKLRMARLLDEMGVDIIEAGFPIASPGDFEAVNEIAKVTKNAVIAGLSRAKKADIEASAQALKPAKNFRIHTFIGTSPLHRQYQLQMPPEEVLNSVAESVAYARGFGQGANQYFQQFRVNIHGRVLGVFRGHINDSFCIPAGLSPPSPAWR